MTSTQRLTVRAALVQAAVAVVLRSIEPDAMLDVVPEHGEVAGQTIGLQLQLLQQPALGHDVAHGQRCVGGGARQGALAGLRDGPNS